MSPKPRCSTCPHAVPLPSGDYLCEMAPSQFTGDPRRKDVNYGARQWRQSVMPADGGCSAHPDFPAWLKEWRFEAFNAPNG